MLKAERHHICLLSVFPSAPSLRRLPQPEVTAITQLNESRSLKKAAAGKGGGNANANADGEGRETVAAAAAVCVNVTPTVLSIRAVDGLQSVLLQPPRMI